MASWKYNTKSKYNVYLKKNGKFFVKMKILTQVLR